MSDKDVTKAILEALRQRHSAANWIFFRELRIGTGYGKDAETRFDAFAIAAWPSSNFHRIVYEVKSSRSDFLAELKHPEKRRPALRMSNEFYFAAPKGMIKPEEVPLEAGLIEYWADGDVPLDQMFLVYAREKGNCHLHIKVPAPHRDTMPPTWRFVAALARRQKREGVE
jgi:hypothetical protein